MKIFDTQITEHAEPGNTIPCKSRVRKQSSLVCTPLFYLEKSELQESFFSEASSNPHLIN